MLTVALRPLRNTTTRYFFVVAFYFAFGSVIFKTLQSPAARIGPLATYRAIFFCCGIAAATVNTISAWTTQRTIQGITMFATTTYLGAITAFGIYTSLLIHDLGRVDLMLLVLGSQLIQCTHYFDHHPIKLIARFQWIRKTHGPRRGTT